MTIIHHKIIRSSELLPQLHAMPHGADIWEVARILGLDDPHSILDFSSNLCPYSMARIYQQWQDSQAASSQNSIDAKAAGKESINEDAMGPASVTHKFIDAKAFDLNSYAQDLEIYPPATYPDLTQALQEHFGGQAPEVLLGNGAAQLIYQVFSSLMVAKRKSSLHVLVAAPAFSEYLRAAEAFQADLTLAPFTEDSLEDFLATLRQGTFDLVILVNPNNPTGIVWPRTALAQVLQLAQKKGAQVLVDECFVPFLTEKRRREVTCLPLLEAYPNQLLILRSFTKLFRLAGLRLGCLLAYSGPLAESIRRQTPAWVISALSAKLGILALRLYAQGAYEPYLRELEEERARLKKALQSLGLKNITGEANFVAFSSPRGEETLLDLLSDRDQPIFLRSCANYEGLDPSYYRAAIKTPTENTLLIQALKASFWRA